MKLNKILCLSFICISVLSFNVPTLASKDLAEVTTNTSNEAVPYADLNKDYLYSSEPISGGTYYTREINLDSTYPYGKVYYSNNSSSSVTLRVKGRGIDQSITIGAYKSNGISWKKSLLGKTYTVSINSPSTQIKGIFTLARWDKPFN